MNIEGTAMRQVIVLAALLHTSALLAAPEIREGLWEVSVRGEVGGQPMSAAPVVVRQCMSQESLQELMTKMGGAGACQVSGFQQNGTRARWNLACTGQMDVTGTGEAEIMDDQFSGRMDIVVSMNGQSVPMVQNFQARRVGECQ